MNDKHDVAKNIASAVAAYYRPSGVPKHYADNAVAEHAINLTPLIEVELKKAYNQCYVLLQTDGYDDQEVCGVINDEDAAKTWETSNKNRYYETFILGEIKQ